MAAQRRAAAQNNNNDDQDPLRRGVPPRPFFSVKPKGVVGDAASGGPATE
jgi:hypothetical protein